MGYVNAPQGRNPWISEPEVGTPRPRIAPPTYSTSRGNFYRPRPGNPENEAGQNITNIATYNARYVREWVMPRVTGDLKQGDENRHSGGKQTTIKKNPNSGPQPPNLHDALDAQQTDRPLLAAMPGAVASGPLSPTLQGPPSPAGPIQQTAPWKEDSQSAPQAPWKSGGNTFFELRDRARSEAQPRPVYTPKPTYEPGPPAPWLGGRGSPAPTPVDTGNEGRPAPWKDGKVDTALALDVAARGFSKHMGNQSRVQARNVQTEGPSLLGGTRLPAPQVGPSGGKRRAPSGMDPRKRGTFYNYE